MDLGSSVDISKFKFVNPPLPKRIEEYTQVIDFSMERLSKLSDVLAIYQTGEISVPGISDIDIKVVLKNDIRNPKLVKKKIDLCFKQNKYLYLHRLDVLNRRVFLNYDLIVPFESKKFRLLYGENLEVKREVNPTLCTIFLIDMLNWMWPRPFLELLFCQRIYIEKSVYLTTFLNDVIRVLGILFFSLPIRKSIDVRATLCQLNAVKHFIQIYKKVTSDKHIIFDEYIRKITSLRKNWISLGHEKYSELINLMKNCILILFEIIDGLHNFLKENGIDVIDVSDCKIFRTDFQTVIYCREYEKKTAIRKMQYYFSHYIIASMLPMNFLVNEYIRNGWRTTADDAYIAFLRNRDLVIQEYLSFLNRYRLEGGIDPLEVKMLGNKLRYFRNKFLLKVEHINTRLFFNSLQK